MAKDKIGFCLLGKIIFTMEEQKEPEDVILKEKKIGQGVKPLSAIAHRMFHPPKLER